MKLKKKINYIFFNEWQLIRQYIAEIEKTRQLPGFWEHYNSFVYYCSNDKAICGCWLACANIELDACCNTVVLANAADSAAKSVS